MSASTSSMSSLSGLLSSFEKQVTQEAVGNAELAAKDNECQQLTKKNEENEKTIQALTDKKTELEMTAIAMNTKNESLTKKVESLERQHEQTSKSLMTQTAKVDQMTKDKSAAAKAFSDKLHEASTTIHQHMK